MERHVSKKPIHTDNAPSAIGTYSQAIESNGLLFMSGQIPLDPQTMEIVAGDFKARAHRVFQNLRNVAEAAGATLDQAIKVNVYLTDLGDFADVNSVMAEYFNEPYPARAAVGVASLPKGVDIEIEAVIALQ
jgi:reactive intermediate/imine deaminase